MYAVIVYVYACCLLSVSNFFNLCRLVDIDISSYLTAMPKLFDVGVQFELLGKILVGNLEHFRALCNNVIGSTTWAVCQYSLSSVNGILWLNERKKNLSSSNSTASCT